MSAALNTGVNYDVFVSVIVPVCNAGPYIENTITEMSALAGTMFRNHEIVIIDNASADRTTDIIRTLQKRIENLQLFCLASRVSFDIATVAGMDNCIGDFVFVLNIESDPVSILRDLWARMQEGNEVVCGVRDDRIRGNLRAWLGRCYYRLFRYATGISIPAGISSPRLYSRRVVGYITENNDRHLMVKVLPFFNSWDVATVNFTAVRLSDQFAEQSMWNAMMTGVTILLGSSRRPLRLFTAMALASSLISLLYSVYVILISIFKRHVVEGWLSLALPAAIISFFLSSLLGIVAEYIYILVQQSGNRPAYSVVAESISSVLEIRKKLNVIEATGRFAEDRQTGDRQTGDRQTGDRQTGDRQIEARPAGSAARTEGTPKSALLGYSGFVGSTLLRQRSFDALFRASNIGEIDGQSFDEIVCAAAPAQKWKANKDPEGDLKAIQNLMSHLATVNCGRFILISTVDVFQNPVDVDEDSLVPEHPEAYGRNRRLLETFVVNRFPNSCIVRLPGLVGPGLRKNVIFDFLNQNNLSSIDSRARFQFYPMVNLWSDIQAVLAQGIKLVHLTAEPLSVAELAQSGFGLSFENHVAAKPADYRFQSRYAGVVGSSGPYQYSKNDTLLAVRAYAQSEPRTLEAK